MSEESPLDPNQVQPPQEDETGHIEVAYHEDGEQPVAEPVETPQASAESGEPTHLGSMGHDDNSTQPTLGEEQVSPGAIRNKAKAAAMADTENLYGHYGYKPDGGAQYRRMNRESIERSVQKAGDEYEVQVLAERDGKTPEQVKELLISDRQAFINYSHAIAENQIKYGDKLSPNLVVLEAVYELASRYPNLITNGRLEGADIWVSFRHSRITGGAADIEVTHTSDRQGGVYKEEWNAPAFNGADGWRNYAVSSHSKHDKDFDSVTTTKRRTMTEEDANALKDLFANANFDPIPEEQYDDDEDEDDHVSSGEIAARARAHFRNSEQAREAAEMYPGDFM